MARYNRPWDPAVLILVIVSLLVGWVIKVSVEGRTTRFSDRESGISLDYPAHWLTMPEEGAILSVIDPQSLSAFKTTLTVAWRPFSKEAGIAAFLTELSMDRGKLFSLYRSFSVGSIKVSGLEAKKVEYVYATDPLGRRPGISSIPVVVRAVDVVVPKGDRVHIFSLAVDEREYDNSLPEFESIIGSIRIQ